LEDDNVLTQKKNYGAKITAKSKSHQLLLL